MPVDNTQSQAGCTQYKMLESQTDSGNGCLQVAAIPQLMIPCSDMYICTAYPCGRMVTVTGCTCDLLNHVHVQL